MQNRFGTAQKDRKLTPLAARKELLVAESELNRLQLLQEIRTVRNELDHLKEQAAVVGSMAASVAKVAVTFSAIRRLFFHGGGKESSSWMSTVLASVQTGASLWGILRSRSKK